MDFGFTSSLLSTTDSQCALEIFFNIMLAFFEEMYVIFSLIANSITFLDSYELYFQNLKLFYIYKVINVLIY